METSSNSGKRQRRLKGEGSIYQTTANGKQIYVAAYSLKDENGKRKTVKGHGSTPQEAIARRQKNFELRAAGGGKKPSKKTLKQAIAIWVEENNSVQENKLRTTRAIEHHIITRIGNPPISNITTKQLKSVFKELESLDEKSVARNAYRSLRAILQFSLKKQWLASSPLQPISEPHYEPAVAKEDDLKASDRSKMFVEFLAWAKQNYPQNYPWLIVMTLGLRPAELCGLELECFDDQNLKIDRQFLTVPTRIEKRTKNKKNRTIKLPLEYYSILTAWLFERPEPNNEVWFNNQLFTYKDTKGIIRGRHTNKTRADWKNMLFEFLTEKDRTMTYEQFLSEKHYRLHFNRHITASNLAAANIPISTAMAILGHMNEKQTQHYTHIYDNAKEQGTQSIAELYT